MNRAFVDTNVLVYIYDNDRPARQAHAASLFRALIRDRSIVMSTQVLQEFYATVTRTFRPLLNPTEAEQAVLDLIILPVIHVDVPIIQAAMSRVQSMSISFWDALIVEAALTAGAERLLTEDLQHGQVIDGVQIENPFLGMDDV